MRLLGAVAAALTIAGVATASTSGEPKKVIIPAVQAKAKAINVRLSDLPAAAGFKPRRGNPDTGTPKCSYYNPDQSDLTENGDAKSPEFTLASGSFVASSTAIFKSAGQGRTAYARVVQPKLPQCLADLFRKGAAPTKVTIVAAEERSFPKLAERSNAYRIQATVAAGGKNVPVVYDVLAMNRTKVDVVIFFAGIGGSYNDSFERRIAAAVAARTKHA